MDKIKSIYRVDTATGSFAPIIARSASSLRVKEKQIENWMATKPELLFSDPSAVMVISQEISGEAMADMLAVDSQGNLIIIEIKRHSSDRGTVGQILDYAAQLSSWKYEDFNRRWKEYPQSKGRDLFEAFQAFIDNPDFDRDDFLKERRLFILAASEDESMKRIIEWLRDSYEVPIDFVPFQFYEEGGRLLLEIAKIPLEPITTSGRWSGDWFFNTNETYARGAYERMFGDSVIAVYGYPNGAGMLAQPAEGERVFAYVNGRGVAAVGRIAGGEAFAANSVFGKQSENEFHRKVHWDVNVDLAKAVKSSEVGNWNYNLPVRSTLCRMYNKKVADRIEEELRRR